MMPVTELPKDYYLQNFCQMTDLVHQQYSDLLSDTESAWLQAFHQAPLDAQKLYVRLLMRKGPLFRLDKLNYGEISDIPNAAEALASLGLVECLPTNVEHCCLLMTKPEMLNTFPGLMSSLSKTAIIEKLMDDRTNPLVVPSPFDVISVLGSDCLKTFLLLYFGNTHQDLAQFVVSDLGIQKFENYAIDRTFRLFQTRDNIDNWLLLAKINERRREAEEQKDRKSIIALADKIPAAFTWPLLETKRMRLINHIARDMEREKLDEEALNLYRQSNIAPSRERQVRLLMKAKRYDEAEMLTKKMLAMPLNEEETQVANKLAIQISRKTHWDWDPPRAFQPREIVLDLNRAESRVEITVSDHFKKKGWNVFYIENLLFNAVFGLFFWDIIYSPIQGAFLNPFQLGPRDTFSSDFYIERKSAIDNRLSNMSSTFSDIYSIYDSKAGINNFWVNWSSIDKDIIRQLEISLNQEQLTEIFKKILFDPKVNRSGFPDLFLVKDNDYLFLEVKGPGDSLRDNQLRWLSTFDTLKIKSAVCWVKYTS